MMVTKHQKPVPQMNIEGGIKKLEAWVQISNVALIDPETGKPTRVKYEFRDGKKVRVAKSGAVIPEPAKFVRRPRRRLKRKPPRKKRGGIGRRIGDRVRGVVTQFGGFRMEAGPIPKMRRNSEKWQD